MAVDTAKELAGLEAPKSKRFTIAEAFKDCTEATFRDCGKATLKVHWYWTKRFMQWLAIHHPNCTHWDLLRCGIVDNYVRSHEWSNQAHPIRPIRRTALYMTRMYGVANFLDGYRVKSALKTTPAEVYLVDAVLLLDWLKERGELRLETGAALQGLAGLQL